MRILAFSDYRIQDIDLLIRFIERMDSTTSFASPKTKSLRATIPEGIVAFLGLRAGDKLDWNMEFRNEERVVEVRKSRPNDGAR